jgi:signal transduction histidine kinase
MSIDRKKLYLAHISHELRTPLTGILGITSLLKEEIAPTMDVAAIPVPPTPSMSRATRSFTDTRHDRSSSSSKHASSLSPSMGATNDAVGRDSAELFQLVHTLSVCTKSLLNIANVNHQICPHLPMA